MRIKPIEAPVSLPDPNLALQNRKSDLPPLKKPEPTPPGLEPASSGFANRSEVETRNSFTGFEPEQGLNFPTGPSIKTRSPQYISKISTIDGTVPERLNRTPGTNAQVQIGTDGAGLFVCDHIATLNQELQAAHPGLITGFIHTPEKPNDNQFAEVLGIGVRGAVEAHEDQSGDTETTVMLTGFTQFGTVTNNATGDFLFGDGKSVNLDSFGFENPARENIDRMMSGLGYGEPSEVTPFVKNGQTVGLTYQFTSPEARTINLALVRLPVDDTFDQTQGNNNPRGDGAGDLLTSSFNAVQPDAVISLGVGIYQADNKAQDTYEVEVTSNGSSNAPTGTYQQPGAHTNNALADIYRQRLGVPNRKP